VLAYAPENAIAEKYQAIVELDVTNSRMKDFHDIWTLARNLEFDGERLSEAIRKTFERRKTDLPKSVPTAFTSEFSDDKIKQTQWRAFLNKGLATGEEVTLADVARVLRNFLLPPTEALLSGRTFKMHWNHVQIWTE